MIGRKVSHYEITAKLGEGGMGVVYEAYDTVLKRKVALKFLPANLTSDEESRKRFVREAQAAATLNHPNICTVHEIGEDEGRTFIVMPCIEGKGLAGRLDEGPLQSDEALDIAIQIGKGLSKAHRNDIVHRDIKPGNILITEDGHVKIVDFGLAKLGSVTKMTTAGTTLGTVGYMSPEQARGDEVDSRSDIWALGVVLYEMLTGRMPFRGEVDAAVIYSIMNEEPEPPVEACPECPEGITDIISIALAKDPDGRFRTMDEMVEALVAVREGKKAPIRRKPSARKGAPGKKLVIPGFIIAMTVVVALAGYWFLGRGHKIESIAVLPIMNLSEDDETIGLADQMTGVLINELGQIRSIRWTSYRSSMKYKGSDKSVPEIAGELGVDAVVEGELLTDGNDITLSLRLVEADPERQIWSEQYKRTLKENFSLYGEISMDFARKLGGVISPDAAAAMANRRDVAPAAYEAYARGIYLLSTFINPQLDEESGERAIQARDYFRRSVEIDSTFAKGWAGLAEAWIRLSHGRAPIPGAVENALEAVTRALELDDALGEAYFTKAHILWEHVWDQEGARKAFDRALELNPSNAYGLIVYAYYLDAWRRFDEGANAAVEAARLDPVSYLINMAAFQPLSLAGRVEEAESQIRKMHEMYPGRLNEIGTLAWIREIYRDNRLFDRAVETHERIWLLQKEELKDSSETVAEEKRLLHLWILAFIRADAGDREEAERLWNEVFSIKDIDTIEKEYPSRAADYYMYHGDNDMEFARLEKMYEERNMWLTRITSLHYYDRLRGDPRYDDLVKRLGLYQPGGR